MLQHMAHCLQTSSIVLRMPFQMKCWPMVSSVLVAPGCIRSSWYHFTPGRWSTWGYLPWCRNCNTYSKSSYLAVGFLQELVPWRYYVVPEQICVVPEQKTSVVQTLLASQLGTGPPVPMASALLCSRGLLERRLGKRRFTSCRPPLLCSAGWCGVRGGCTGWGAFSGPSPVPAPPREGWRVKLNSISYPRLIRQKQGL
jgi:hypothetical protein